MVRRRIRYVVALSAGLLLFLLLPFLADIGDFVRQTNRFSGQRDIEQAFAPTEEELACLLGKPVPGSSTIPKNAIASRDTIPNIVHFIFGMKNPIDTPRGRQFDFVSYLAVRSAIISLGPEAIYLHYTYLSDPPSSDVDADPLSNPWVRRLQNHIKLAHHEPRTMGPKSFAHASDILRLELLRDTGGIYLDMDSFALRPFDQLLQSPYSRGRDVVLGHEGGNRWGLCNAVMVARPNSTFVERWLSTYYGTEATIKEESNTNTESTVLTLDNEWNYHSVTWPKEAQQKHPDEWMHEELDPVATRHWQGAIEANGGALFKNQLAYHAWSQMAWKRHLSKLTPEVVRTKNTRFNLLVRRFVEDDV